MIKKLLLTVVSITNGLTLFLLPSYAGIGKIPLLRNQSEAQQMEECDFVAEVQLEKFQEATDTRKRMGRQFDDSGSTFTETQIKVIAHASITKIKKKPSSLKFEKGQKVSLVFWRHLSGKVRAAPRTASEEPLPHLGKITVLVQSQDDILKVGGAYELTPTIIWTKQTNSSAIDP